MSEKTSRRNNQDFGSINEQMIDIALKASLPLMTGVMLTLPLVMEAVKPGEQLPNDVETAFILGVFGSLAAALSLVDQELIALGKQVRFQGLRRQERENAEEWVL